MNATCAEHSCPVRECEGVTLTIAVNDRQVVGLARALVWAGAIVGSWVLIVGPILLVGGLLTRHR